ncbi:MAG: HisA/HisF-related TIM barrel protein [Methanolinea sp.]|nr:HisA/HisF-related TIM barrel protein [Methanolinea sp.]
MDVILAVDVKDGLVVQGESGNRGSYRPLTWGLSPTAEPAGYITSLSPRNLYIADLDRIMGKGDNTETILSCSRLVERCLLDRGARTPGEFLEVPGITDIASTESSVVDLARYPGGILSLDMRDGRVIPSGEDPRCLLARAEEWNFSGAIILNISAVGTGCGISLPFLRDLRDAYSKELIYGGGISTSRDLDALSAIGFEGVIVATALHRGTVPLDALRRGKWC